MSRLLAVIRSDRAKTRLVVMTRFPTPGVSKTRLATALGDDGAARVANALGRHCVRRMHAVALSGEVELEVRADGANAVQVRRWLGRRVRVRQQADGDLGDRLADAMRVAFSEGASSAIAVGSDIPDLGGSQVRSALEALESHDVVLGPAADGGYYLVGLRSGVRGSTDTLFGRVIPWGSDGVLNATRAAIEQAGLTPAFLETLSDIDRPDDLPVWERLLVTDERTRHSPQLSVVIPALDEADRIRSAIGSAREAGVEDVIVADGGSSDDTADVARDSGARVVVTARGRATQMNAGAAGALGDVLLFLHADSRLPPDAAQHVRRALSDRHMSLGAFRFRAGDPGRAVDRLITGAGRLRHRVFDLPYGDQGFFVLRRDFEDLGGFPDLPVMEDYEFARRCRRLGRIATAEADVWTSARRWHDRGLVRTTILDMAIIAGYRLGASPDRLAAARYAGTRE